MAKLRWWDRIFPTQNSKDAAENFYAARDRQKSKKLNLEFKLNPLYSIEFKSRYGFGKLYNEFYVYYNNSVLFELDYEVSEVNDVNLLLHNPGYPAKIRATVNFVKNDIPKDLINIPLLLLKFISSKHLYNFSDNTHPIIFQVWCFMPNKDDNIILRDTLMEQAKKFVPAEKIGVGFGDKMMESLLFFSAKTLRKSNYSVLPTESTVKTKRYNLKLKEWSWWNPFNSSNEFDSGGLNRVQFRKQFLEFLSKSIGFKVLKNTSEYSVIDYYADSLEYQKDISSFDNEAINVAKEKLGDVLDDDIFLLKQLSNKEWFDFIMHCVVNIGTNYLFQCRSYETDRAEFISGYKKTPNSKISRLIYKTEKLIGDGIEDKYVSLYTRYDYIDLGLEYVQKMNPDIVIVTYDTKAPDARMGYKPVSYTYVSKQYAKQYVSLIHKYDINRFFNPEYFTPYPRLAYMVRKGVKL